ncbi:hypothetical protein [Leisingera sp. ANG-M7]|uniref:hypothetical protein n=1 Tax=Leisingera sp. ANG-M7 TaxID=1577902 RepID=UPI00058090CD|nr:hypothetical protein [Leisingera sp. ANG-M7]KIC39386.1 hypothetical protein RA26_01685 [Leisingera sp. ANG-M7]
MTCSKLDAAVQDYFAREAAASKTPQGQDCIALWEAVAREHKVEFDVLQEAVISAGMPRAG